MIKLSVQYIEDQFVDYRQKLKSLIFKKSDVDSDYQSLPAPVVKQYNKSRHHHISKLCYAPFTSLYFGMRGEVVACCANRDYILGYIYKESIKDIWFGDRLKKLRTHIDNNDLNLGCFRCAEAIRGGNNSGIAAVAYDNVTMNRNKYPSRFDFEIDNTCNLACITCNGYLSSTYRKKNDRLPPYPQHYDESFIDQLEEFLPHLKQCNFLGGEPFLSDLYFQIWDRLLEVNKNCSIVIQTNGTVLNKKVKSFLEKRKVYLGVSVDGISKSMYESIRTYGNFDKLLENLNYFKDYCKRNNITLSISFCPQRKNWKEIPEFINFANKYNALAFFNTVHEPHGEALWTLDPDTLTVYLNYFKSFRFENNNAIQNKNVKHFNDFILQMEKWIAESVERSISIKTNETKTTQELLSLVLEKLGVYAGKTTFNDHAATNDLVNGYRAKLKHYIQADEDAARNKFLFLSVLKEDTVLSEVHNFIK